MNINIPDESYLLLGLFAFDAVVILIFTYMAIFKKKKTKESKEQKNVEKIKSQSNTSEETKILK